MPKMQSENRRPVSARMILVALVALLLFALLLSSVLGLMSKYNAMRKHIRDLKVEQSNLKEKQEKIHAMNQYISTPEGEEEILRNKYRLVKPGEGIIVITNPEVVATPEDQKYSSITRFWQSILRGLGVR